MSGSSSFLEETALVLQLIFTLKEGGLRWFEPLHSLVLAASTASSHASPSAQVCSDKGPSGAELTTSAENVPSIPSVSGQM